jgi:hypothetical protein
MRGSVHFYGDRRCGVSTPIIHCRHKNVPDAGQDTSTRDARLLEILTERRREEYEIAALHCEVFEVRAARYGEDHPSTLEAMENLAGDVQ